MTTAIPREKVLRFRQAFWNAWEHLREAGEPPIEITATMAATMAAMYAEGPGFGCPKDMLLRHTQNYIAAEKTIAEEARK